MKTKFLYLLTLILAVSCKIQDPVEPKGSGLVTFNVSLPQQTPIATRAAYSDTDINNVDLLIFDQSGVFIERIKVDVITGSGATKSFTAQMDLSNQARRIHIIANGRNADNSDRLNFSTITANMAEATAMAALRTTALTSATAASILPLIMWGRTDVTSISSSTTVSGLKLIRSQACIQLIKGTPTATNGLANFTLSTYTMLKVPEYGKVTPANIASSATIPTVGNIAGAADLDYYNAGLPGGGTWQSAATLPFMYMYERNNNATNYSSILIFGSYNGVAGYYKVVMADNAEVPMNIVRNHRYNVTITKAYGPGYSTVAQAISNPPANALKVQIIDATDDIAIMIGDGQNELGVSHNELTLVTTSTPARTVFARVFATRSASLTATSSNAQVTSLQFAATAIPNVMELSGLWTGSPTSGTITVSVNNLSLDIKLVPAFALSAVNSYARQYTVFTTLDKNWQATIVSPKTGLAGLSYSIVGLSTLGTTGAWEPTMVQTLQSLNGTACYLYTSLTGVTTLDVKYVDGLNASHSRKAIFAY